MSTDRVTRRQFVTRATSSLVTISLINGRFANGGSALAATPVVRRDIAGLNASDPTITSYRKAIKAMKALNISDPRSWMYQAAIHGTNDSQALPAWNTCTHHNAFFWSWHRMYLYWFERIVRKMSDDPAWALPYWNWTSQNARQIPAVFRDRSSELYVASRDPGMNSGGAFRASVVDYSRGFAVIDFSSASDAIESAPHDNVHVGVGGENGWMANTLTAAQDPVFFVHHCNMDRLWNLWLAQGNGRSNPIRNGNWASQKFMFFDENGQEVTMSGCDVLLAAQQLNYTYEVEPAQVAQSCALAVASEQPTSRSLLYVALWEPITLGNDPVTANFNVKDEVRSLAAAESKEETLFLEVDGVEAEKQPGVVWEVYLGASEEEIRRGIESPFYVGSMALFSVGIRADAHHGFRPARFLFPIKRAVRSALKARETTSLPLTFVPIGPLIDGKPSPPEVAAKVTVVKLSVVIEGSAPAKNKQ